MTLEDFKLPAPWDGYLRQIEMTSQGFWERRRYRSYVRLQDAAIWLELRRRLWEISNVLVVKPLTPFETFLLHAATPLYEVGWQATNAPQLSLRERYAESGQMIRNSVGSARGDLDFGLFSLERATIDTLARICTAVGSVDLAALSIQPEPAGYLETVRLRYLVAQLQLADLLLVHRTNENLIRNLASLDTANLADARLALKPYISLIDLKKNGLTAHFRIHPDDEHLAGKMSDLFEKPIRIWWASNWEWLSKDFRFFLSLNEPKIDIIHEGLLPLPLKSTCKALLNFLEEFKPSDVQLPLNTTEISPVLPPMRTTTSTPGNAAVEVRRESVPVVQRNSSIADPKAARTSAFISYSHKDRRFLEELHVHLAYYVRKEVVDYWDDTKIPPGSNWREEVAKALQSAKVAVLLISPDFLASDFIAQNELPPLLAAAKQEGAVILCVILKFSAFEDTDLAQFQTVNVPSDPLSKMKPWKRDKVWNKVSELVRDALKTQI